MAIDCDEKSIPVSRDFDVQVTKGQVAESPDLTTVVFATPEAAGVFPPDAGRVRYYSSVEDLESDLGQGESYNAATAFFSQSPHPQQMAVGAIFETDVAGYFSCGPSGPLEDFQDISDGSLQVTIDDDPNNLSDIDFSEDDDFVAMAATLQTKIRDVGDGGFLLATVVYEDDRFIITSGTSGDLSKVDISSGSGGTDIFSPEYLNGIQGTQVDGHTAGTLTEELSYIAEAASCAGQGIYGWELDAKYRNDADQLSAAQWISGRDGIMSITSNSATAKSASTTDDIGSVLRDEGNDSVFCFYHDKRQYYPGMSYMALFLSVDYNAENSTINGKFKDLPGIPTVGLTSTELNVLEDKRYNTFVLMSNNLRSTRQGVVSSPSWFLDQVVNIDNFVADVENEVSLYFHRTPKVKYTPQGVAAITGVIQRVCSLYVSNGTFADRRVQSSTEASGFITLPATVITSTPIEDIPESDYLNGIGPVFTIDCQLAQSINSLRIRVNV